MRGSPVCTHPYHPSLLLLLEQVSIAACRVFNGTSGDDWSIKLCIDDCRTVRGQHCQSRCSLVSASATSTEQGAGVCPPCSPCRCSRVPTSAVGCQRHQRQPGWSGVHVVCEGGLKRPQRAGTAAGGGRRSAAALLLHPLPPATQVYDAISAFQAAGGLFVAAAGNEGTNQDTLAPSSRWAPGGAQA